MPPMKTYFLPALKDTKGAVLVEFALIMPIFLMIIAIVLELGLALHQENTLEKSIMAATGIASRSGYPINSATSLRVNNMAKTGNVNGGAYLMPGWEDSGSSLNITTSTYNLDGTIVPYVRVDATVPYQPLLPGLLDFLGFNNFNLTAAHEEVFIN
jgi:Flp pilus assembly protein TadG